VAVVAGCAAAVALRGASRVMEARGAERGEVAVAGGEWRGFAETVGTGAGLAYGNGRGRVRHESRARVSMEQEAVQLLSSQMLST